MSRYRKKHNKYKKKIVKAATYFFKKKKFKEKFEEIGSDEKFIDSYVSTFLVSELENSQSWLVGGLTGEFFKAGEKRKRPENRNYLSVNVSMNSIKKEEAIAKAQEIKKKVIPDLIATLTTRFDYLHKITDLNKRYLHGGRTTMLYLNLSGHDLI